MDIEEAEIDGEEKYGCIGDCPVDSCSYFPADVIE